MRTARDYSRVIEQGLHRLRRLDQTARSLSTSSVATERDVTFLTLEAHALWYNFNRAVYFAAATGARHPLYGHLSTAHGVLDRQKAMDLAVWTKNPMRKGESRKWTFFQEPAWANHSEMSKVIRALSPTNQSDIDLALGVQATFLTDMVRFRNFFAHKNESTVQKLHAVPRTYPIANGRPAVEFLTGRTYGNSTPPLLRWLEELRQVIELY